MSSSTTTITKKQQVINMCRAEGGTTVAAIAAKLVISKTAARSLIGDIRHAKLVVTCVNNVYTMDA
jgi:predicted ArsR family transcriptional regulator